MMLPTPLPIQPIFGQDGLRDQGNREVLHDQGEDYQQPINFRSGSRQVPKSVGDMSGECTNIGSIFLVLHILILS